MLVHDRSSKEEKLLMIMPVSTTNRSVSHWTSRRYYGPIELSYTASIMSELLPTNPDGKERLIGLALDGLASPHTRRAYRAALDEFLTWSQGQQPSVLCKALAHRYKAMLIEKELAPATINQRLAAVRRLAQEAADNGLLGVGVASSISKVRGIR